MSESPRTSRALKGELNDAADLGVQALRISGTLHLNDLSLVIMPSLIEIMVTPAVRIC